VKFMANMDQYSEYFDAIPPETYATFNDTIKLTKRRLLFDCYALPSNYKGTITIYNTNKIVPLVSESSLSTSSVVTWNFNYNCFTLIKIYFQKLLSLIEQGEELMNYFGPQVLIFTNHAA
jgi:hypothetical protein